MGPWANAGRERRRKGSKGKVPSQRREKCLGHEPDQEVSAEVSGAGIQTCISTRLIQVPETLTAAPSRKVQSLPVPTLVWGGQLALIRPAGQSLVIASGWVSKIINRILACTQTPQCSARAIKFGGLNCPHEVSQLLIIL